MDPDEWIKHINELDAYYCKTPRPYNARFHSSDEFDEIRMVLEDWKKDRKMLLDKIEEYKNLLHPDEY